jgi:hypothetical protein
MTRSHFNRVLGSTLHVRLALPGERETARALVVAGDSSGAPEPASSVADARAFYCLDKTAHSGSVFA